MSSENIEAFMNITGASKSKARKLLTLFQDNLQVSIENFFEQSENFSEEDEESEEVEINGTINNNIVLYDEEISKTDFERSGIFGYNKKFEDEESPKSEHSSQDGLEELIEQLKESSIDGDENNYLKLIKKTQISSNLPFITEKVEFLNEEKESLPPSIFRKIITVGDDIYGLCVQQFDEDDMIVFCKLNLTKNIFEHVKLPDLFTQDLSRDFILMSHFVSRHKELYLFVGEENSTLIFSIIGQKVNRVTTGGDIPKGVPLCALSFKDKAYLLLVDEQEDSYFMPALTLAEVFFYHHF